MRNAGSVQNACVNAVAALTFGFAVWFAYADRQLDAFTAANHIEPPAATWLALTWLATALLFFLPVAMHRALYQPELQCL
jgi:hypothetical protein